MGLRKYIQRPILNSEPQVIGPLCKLLMSEISTNGTLGFVELSKRREGEKRKSARTLRSSFDSSTDSDPIAFAIFFLVRHTIQLSNPSIGFRMIIMKIGFLINSPKIIMNRLRAGRGGDHINFHFFFL